MSRVHMLLAVATLTLCGCGDGPATNTARDASEAIASTPAGDGFALNGENTKIEFVGTHVGEKPDPRKGGFKNVSGTIGIQDGSIASIVVEIETASIYTEIEKLTNHLKSPDFFDVREHPNASFKSTKIDGGSDGLLTVTGDLTLLGKTKAISFPAKASVSNGKVKLESSFEIDRTEFGINYSVEKVEKIVSMTITVGS